VGIADMERTLTATGRRQAVSMASWLKNRMSKKMRIITAPSLRTRQTADCLELPYEIERKIGVGADPAELLATAQWPDSSMPVLLVSHQPAIGRLASLLIGDKDVELPIKKCGVFWFSTREREHRMQVVLRAVMHPDLI
jgi:phosphohistidine phosphatase